MKTILIYGAPGVGKLTVANALSKITGYKVLHNHLFNDFVGSVFKFGTPAFWETVHAYRLDLMERAAKNKARGIILTWVYAKPADDVILRSVVRQARKHNSKILFVHLICGRKELLERVKNPSRKAFAKVKTHTTLHSILKRHDLFSDVDYRPNFVLDNSKVSPHKAAKFIQQHYRL